MESKAKEAVGKSTVMEVILFNTLCLYNKDKAFKEQRVRSQML